MSTSGTTTRRAIQLNWFGKFRSYDSPLINGDSVSVQLEASLARETALRQKIEDLVRHQNAQVEEFDHRLLNGIQMIISLLSAQSRTASAETAAQLKIAINRILAFGHVHRRLHLLDRQESVEFKQYLKGLCEDLSGLLSSGMSANAIVVEGDICSIPATLSRPLGLIVSELITNARKHGEGRIVVRLETPSPYRHLISVVDEGPGLPVDFKPDERKGLGMKIIGVLTSEIGGELRIVRGENQRRHFAISFRSPQ